MEKQQKKNRQKDKKSINNFAKYSGIGIQMLGIIGGGVWLGQYLDNRQGNDFPLFTLILSLFSVFAAIYIAIKDFIK